MELHRRRPKVQGCFQRAFIEGTVIAWSEKPSDVCQVLSFLAICYRRRHRYSTRAGRVFEDKYDGFRMIAEIRRGKVALYSRNGKIISHSYIEVAKALEGV